MLQLISNMDQTIEDKSAKVLNYELNKLLFFLRSGSQQLIDYCVSRAKQKFRQSYDLFKEKKDNPDLKM